MSLATYHADLGENFDCCVPALCNSCLRIRFFDAYVTAHAADCVCGAKGVNGDAFCTCPSCAVEADYLLDGCRDHVMLGVSLQVNLDGWTPETGVFRLPASERAS